MDYINDIVLTENVTDKDIKNASYIIKCYEIKGHVDFDNDLFFKRVLPFIERDGITYRLLYNNKVARFDNLNGDQLDTIVTAYVVMRREIDHIGEILKGVK